jgi:centrin-1
MATNKSKAQPQTKQPEKKKVERPGLSQDEVDEIRQAFDLFDTNQTGKIDPKELKAAMQSLGFDTKNPTIFQMIAELDTPEAQKKGGVDFDTFVEAINNKLGDKETKDGIRRIFNLFIDDPQQETITLASLRRIARELGEQMSNDELKDMLERASSNGTELTFEEFYDIMTKKSFA